MNRSSRYLFVIFVLVLVSALSVAYVFLGSVTAIKGSYVLLGVLLAATLYRSRGTSDESLGKAEPFGRWSTKVVMLLASGAYITTYVTGTRLVAVVVALGVGYSLFAYQILFAGVTRAIIPQLAVLFTVSPVTKYLSTGFYYGETDLFGHVRAIEVLYRTGRLDTIASVYATYDSFPVLHITSGAISSFTGLPAYDSLIILGIVTYSSVTLAVFYLGRDLLSPSKALLVTFIFSTLSVVHNYTTYFFPQALATALVFALLYAIIRRESVPNWYRAPLSVMALLVTGALAFAHHVTQILLVGIVAALYAPSILRLTRVGRKWQVNDALPKFVPALLALSAGVTHLSVTRTGIIGYFAQFTTNKVSNPFVSDSGGERTVIGLGSDIPFHTPRIAVESLFSVDGLYFIGVTALFVAGVVTVLTQYRRYTNVAGVMLLGFGSALAVLKTPLLSTVSRLSLPLTLFFALIVGIGLWRITMTDDSPNENNERRIPRRRLVLSGLVVLVGVTGPLVASDDLYGLHAGPNMWETYSTPEQQVDFSKQELREFEALTGHVDQYDTEVTMLWVSREASKRFGGKNRSMPTAISKSGIRADSMLAYRTGWTEHQVGYSTDVLGTMNIADWWLQREIQVTNKVYTTGTSGVLWEKDIYLSNNRSGQ